MCDCVASRLHVLYRRCSVDMFSWARFQTFDGDGGGTLPRGRHMGKEMWIEDGADGTRRLGEQEEEEEEGVWADGNDSGTWDLVKWYTPGGSRQGEAKDRDEEQREMLMTSAHASPLSTHQKRCSTYTTRNPPCHRHCYKTRDTSLDFSAAAIISAFYFTYIPTLLPLLLLLNTEPSIDPSTHPPTLPLPSRPPSHTPGSSTTSDPT